MQHVVSTTLFGSNSSQSTITAFACYLVTIYKVITVFRSSTVKTQINEPEGNKHLLFYSLDFRG